MDARSSLVWAKRLTVTEQALRTYFSKNIAAFTKDAKPESTKQQKVKCQLNESSAKDLMRVCCLWWSLTDQIILRCGEEKAKQLQELFNRGSCLRFVSESVSPSPLYIGNTSLETIITIATD